MSNQLARGRGNSTGFHESVTSSGEVSSAARRAHGCNRAEISRISMI
jgi:hypothetical protein